MSLPFLLVAAAGLAGCTAAAPASTPPARVNPGRVGPPTPIPTPVVGATVTLATCCAATIPAGWTSPGVVNNGLEGVTDSSGKLNVTWQVVGVAKRCPVEPIALTDSLTSPTHPSGVTITAIDALLVDGHTAVVYVSAPSNTTEHNYQFFDTDVVIGGNCVDIGGADYGDASAANLETLLQIAASTRALDLPPAPASRT